MIVLKVNGIDKTDQVDWKSLMKTEVLTKEPDFLEFSIKNYGSKTYRPALGDEVTLFEDATKIYGGVVVDTKDAIVGRLKFFAVKCKDFTHTLDRQLVAKTYTGETANAIIANIVSLFVEAGFTTTNVVAPTVVAKIVFNYLTVSQALQKMAETLTGYDWYVDYDKDIHFFQSEVIPAPFSLTDTSDNFVWDSLQLTQDIHQLRNHIIIRGGDIPGTGTQTDPSKDRADGEQRKIFIGYSLDNASFEKALSSTPSTFFGISVGRDGIDNPADFDSLYNPNDGLLIFPESTKPASGDRIRTSGAPFYPFIAQVTNPVSVAQFGTFQYIIIDKTIKSESAAAQRATAEFEKYANPAKFLRFTTYTSGLRTGQTLTVGSTIRDISNDFRIERITTSLRSPSTLRYEVEALASEDVTMVDVLNKLLVKDPSSQVEIGENEIVHRILTEVETITFQEAFAFPSHNTQSETLTNTEVDIEQPLNYDIRFVVGPYIPTVTFNGADKKRLFLVNGSYIAPAPQEIGLFDLLAVQGVTHATIPVVRGLFDLLAVQGVTHPRVP